MNQSEVVQVDSISFSPAELQVLCGLLSMPNPWGSNLSADDRAADALARHTERLRERGAVHPTEPEVALPVAEMLRLIARPMIDIDVRFAGPLAQTKPRLVRLCGDGRAIVEAASDDASTRFTPFASADLLPRWARLCGLDDRPRPSGRGFTTSLVALDDCKDAAESGDRTAAAAVLRDGGVAADVADAFATALASIEQTVAVRLTMRAGHVRQGVELFWLDSPGQRWALPSLLSPFARSAADSSGVADGAGRWTVDPTTTMLTVEPTDGTELLDAMHAALTAASTSTPSNT